MQQQLQWRGMGSKLEKGLEGKKNERFGAQISIIRHQVSESQTHFSHLLLPFLFLFSSCLYRSKISLPCRRSEKKKKKKNTDRTLESGESYRYRFRHVSDTGTSPKMACWCNLGNEYCRTPILRQKWRVGANLGNEYLSINQKQLLQLAWQTSGPRLLIFPSFMTFNSLRIA